MAFTFKNFDIACNECLVFLFMNGQKIHVKIAYLRLTMKTKQEEERRNQEFFRKMK